MTRTAGRQKWKTTLGARRSSLGDTKMATRAQVHYMVDCFFPDASSFDGFRTKSFRIAVIDEQHAIQEGQAHARAMAPHHFRIRAVRRSGDTIIYRWSKEDDSTPA